MTIGSARKRLAVAGSMVTAGVVAFAASPHFSNFTPLTASAGPTADEAFPITFGSDIRQMSIADRNTQLAADKPNAGAWDMITLNETGPDAGRFLLMLFETGAGGVQRHDLWTGATDTIWQSGAFYPATRMDPGFWTPWGTFVTGEENWGDCGAPAYTCGRLFEFKNPTTAPAIFNPVTEHSNDSADFTHKNVIPRVSHEGVQFDAEGNMYFIDECNCGLYKYSPKASFRDVMRRTADYFAAGQTFVLRVGDGSVASATGAYEWIPITDTDGHALAGAVVVTDSNGLTSVDARATTTLAAFKGTFYNRPEDLQVQTLLNGRQYLYVNATGTHETYRLDLRNQVVSVFVDRNTIDLATGLAVGSAFANPDNLAVDGDGNLFIVEDRNGAVDDDIWFAKDLNNDGDLLDPGEGIGRWATNGTPGSEFTGLYFDPFNRRRAWVNIQHPNSDNDRTMELTLPGGNDD